MQGFLKLYFDLREFYSVPFQKLDKTSFYYFENFLWAVHEKSSVILKYYKPNFVINLFSTNRVLSTCVLLCFPKFIQKLKKYWADTVIHKDRLIKGQPDSRIDGWPNKFDYCEPVYQTLKTNKRMNIYTATSQNIAYSRI